MSWNVKPSATTRIHRRSEPYVTEEMRTRLREEILPRYAVPQGALLPILHDIQHRYRHIPHQAMEEVAELLGITSADVLDTVSFYDEFKMEATGRCVIGVCQSIACEVCGHEAILDHLRGKLDLEVGETSDDGEFTLLAMECLGSCDTAPVALFDETLHEGLTIDAIDRLIEKVRQGGGAGEHPHG
ncbi:MAG: NAD(P)H-dependent oxidoreductase subunit E [Phycisphaerales bacterium]|jgi:NADH-quinone oxidoreductase subunit E